MHALAVGLDLTLERADGSIYRRVVVLTVAGMATKQLSKAEAKLFVGWQR